jgi:hypothetical protein
MEIGREYWPLFLAFDVRSIGGKGNRRVHDHGNYGHSVRIKRVGAGAGKTREGSAVLTGTSPSSVGAHRASYVLFLRIS